MPRRSYAYRDNKILYWYCIAIEHLHLPCTFALPVLCVVPKPTLQQHYYIEGWMFRVFFFSYNTYDHSYPSLCSSQLRVLKLMSLHTQPMIVDNRNDQWKNYGMKCCLWIIDSLPQMRTHHWQNVGPKSPRPVVAVHWGACIRAEWDQARQKSTVKFHTLKSVIKNNGYEDAGFRNWYWGAMNILKNNNEREKGSVKVKLDTNNNQKFTNSWKLNSSLKYANMNQDGNEE